MNKSGTHLLTTACTKEHAVGGWTIGKTLHIHIAEKPTEEQIKNTEKLLGWKWFDETI